MHEIKHFINGTYVSSQSLGTFDDINPANGDIIARVHEGGRVEVTVKEVEQGRPALVDVHVQPGYRSGVVQFNK